MSNGDKAKRLAAGDKTNRLSSLLKCHLSRSVGQSAAAEASQTNSATVSPYPAELQPGEYTDGKVDLRAQQHNARH